jgi:hypothetical protein
MYSDEYLEHWGTVFVAARLLEQGIPFQEFLEDPRGYLNWPGPQSASLSLACACRPLLPRQIKVAQALWRRWEPETDRNRTATPTPDMTLADENRHP